MTALFVIFTIIVSVLIDLAVQAHRKHKSLKTKPEIYLHDPTLTMCDGGQLKEQDMK
jgi:hypothetical protein